MSVFYRYLFLLCGAIFLLSPTAHSQYTVCGRVIDASTKEPLGLAAIADPVARTTGLTDEQGNFRLKTSSADTTIITVSFMGYQLQRIKVKPGRPSTVLIQLEK